MNGSPGAPQAVSTAAGAPTIIHLRLAADRDGAWPSESTLGKICEAITPRWQIQAGQVYLDISGSGRLYGWGPDGAARVCRLAAAQVPVQAAGAAATRIAARLASLLCRRWGPGRVLVVPAGNAAEFLGQFPIVSLEEFSAQASRLRELGVRTIGDLQTVPQALLRAVFGQVAEDLAAAATGRPESAAAWTNPVAEPSILVAGVRLLRPLTSPEGMLALADGLALRALAVCRAGPGGRSWWQLRAYLPGGPRQQASARGAGPASLPVWRGLLLLLLKRLPASRQGLVRLELRAGPARGPQPPQGLLFPEDDKARRLASVLGRLNGGGSCSVRRASEHLLSRWGATWYGPEGEPGS